jgi:hypothetical protein
MSEVQEPQSQATDLLLSNGDVQEELNCPTEIKSLLARDEGKDADLRQGE